MVYTTLNLAYSKEHILLYVVNILYNIIISKPFIFFYMIYNLVIMTVTCDGYVI